jgi:hypothetical protein
VKKHATAKKAPVRRRDVLRALGFGAGAAVAASAPLVEAVADSKTKDDRLKSRYQADSPEVQTYYRVNRYPK